LTSATEEERMRKLGLLAVLGAGLALATRNRHVRAVGHKLFAGVRRAVTMAPEYDDQTLKAKVESELFREEHALKGLVNVNVQHGVTQLRGELDSPAMIDELVGRTQKVRGVREVENLLHLPGTPAPMHQ
jgi:osmotically-inducible protein OsmY